MKITSTVFVSESTTTVPKLDPSFTSPSSNMNCELLQVTPPSWDLRKAMYFDPESEELYFLASQNANNVFSSGASCIIGIL